MALIDAQVDTVTDFDVYGPTLTLSTGAGSMAQAAKRLEHDFDDGRQRERQQPTFSLSGYFFNDISMFEQKKDLTSSNDELISKPASLFLLAFLS